VRENSQNGDQKTSKAAPESNPCSYRALTGRLFSIFQSERLQKHLSCCPASRTYSRGGTAWAQTWISAVSANIPQTPQRSSPQLYQ
jgi:hypothetical protein